MCVCVCVCVCVCLYVLLKGANYWVLGPLGSILDCPEAWSPPQKAGACPGRDVAESGIFIGLLVSTTEL